MTTKEIADGARLSEKETDEKLAQIREAAPELHKALAEVETLLKKNDFIIQGLKRRMTPKGKEKDAASKSSGDDKVAENEEEEDSNETKAQIKTLNKNLTEVRTPNFVIRSSLERCYYMYYRYVAICLLTH